MALDLYFSRVHEHWKSEDYFKVHRRVLPRGVGIFVGWRNLEGFALLIADSFSFYVRVPPCWGEYEVWRVLFASSPSVLAYYSNYTLRFLLLKSNIIWRIALSEYIVFSVISIHSNEWDGTTEIRFPYDSV